MAGNPSMCYSDWRAALAFLLLAGLIPVSVQAIPNYSVIDLGELETGFGFLGSQSETVVGMNDVGQVTGSLYNHTENRFVPAIWELGNLAAGAVELTGLIGDSYAQGINNRGEVVGSGHDGTHYNTGFVDTPSGAGGRTVQLLATLPPSGGSRPFAINDHSRIAGGADDGTGAPQQAFYSDDFGGTIQTLGGPAGDTLARDVAENGRLAGISDGTAALFTGTSIIPLDTDALFTYSDAFALNEYDEVVGYGTLVGGDRHAFYFDPGVGAASDLGSYAGDSIARDINNASQIVGKTEINPGSSATRGFLYEADGDQEMILLNTLLSQDDVFSRLANVREAIAINDLGQILAMGTRLEERYEDPSDPTTRWYLDTGELHAFVLDPAAAGNQPIPLPQIMVETEVIHGPEVLLPASLNADSGILVLEQEYADPDGTLGGHSRTRARAEGLITSVGVPTAGSLALSGGRVPGLLNWNEENEAWEQCDQLDNHCVKYKEASSVSTVVSNLMPLFADPDAAPDSIDLDLDLHIDGILDIAWFYESQNVTGLAEAFAQTTVTATLHTQDGEILLFDGSATLERVGTSSATLNLAGEWADHAGEGFTIVEDSAFKEVPNQYLRWTNPDGSGVPLYKRNDPIRTATEFVQVNRSWEDIAFLSPGEIYALELRIETYALSQDVLDYTGLSDEAKECLREHSCSWDELTDMPPDLFILDDSFALANMLETVFAQSGSNTPGVSFVAVDQFGNPLPAQVDLPLPSTLWLLLPGLMGVVISRRRAQHASVSIVPHLFFDGTDDERIVVQ